MAGHVRMENAARTDFHGDEDIQDAERYRHRHEKIAGDDPLRMVADEGGPTLAEKQPTRTAVYGPVRTVVWQGSAGDRRPYADQSVLSVAIGAYRARLTRRGRFAEASSTVGHIPWFTGRFGTHNKAPASPPLGLATMCRHIVSVVQLSTMIACFA